MSKDFVHAKVCHIPGFFVEDITVIVDASVSQDVLKNYAMSLAWGGNFRISEMTVKTVKFKRKVFDEKKTILPKNSHSSQTSSDIVVVPFRPVDGYKVQSDVVYSEQYMVDYTHIAEDGLWKFGQEIFCVENSRQAHEQVESFAKNYLSTVKSLTSVKITGVTYC